MPYDVKRGLSTAMLAIVCTIVQVVAAQDGAAASLSATLMPDGSVRFGAGKERVLKPMAILPKWIGAASRGGYELKKPGVAAFRLESDGTTVMDAKTALESLADGKARVTFLFTPRADVRVLAIGCTIHLPTAGVTGRPWRIDEREGVFAKPAGGGITVARRTCRTVAFPGETKDSVLRLDVSNPADCLIQDNWKWGNTFSIRLGTLSERVCKAGETISFAFDISSDVPVAVAEQRPYVIREGDEWKPLAEHRDILAGSALDFSNMGFTDAPAGKHGWLRNVGGHFEFEKLPGKPRRFYGVNLCGTANYPDPALADALVCRFRRFGYNAIRLHHHDASAVAGSADSVTLNAANMDKLDYLVAAAIREGLYVTTDLFVSRTRAITWRNLGIDREGHVEMQLFKVLCAVYDPAFENWAAFAKNFLEHRNPHTGRRYLDEPALPLISLVNEGGVFMGWKRGVSDDPRVIASWRAWLAAKRVADQSFAPGIDGETLPKNYWDPKTRPFIEQWAGELEVKMVARMKAYLRALGCKALITNDNCGPHYTARNGMAGDYDYIDDHFYVDHPQFLEQRWRLPSSCPNVNPLLGNKPVIPVERDFPRVAGKPFTITEWNFSGPGRYRGVGGILTGATAAMGDWDGLWRFAYSHTKDGLGDTDVRAPGYFDLAADPLALASDRASVCLFLRGDMPPGANECLKMDRARGSFTIDTPRTVGGFAPEGTIEAGVLRATLSGAPATVCVHALEDEPIAQSRRMLLTHLTDVHGEGAKFTDESMTTLLSWGGRPLVGNGTAEIALALSAPHAFEVWELAANGRRVRQMACTASDGRLRFTASVAGPDGARMMYEVIKRQ